MATQDEKRIQAQTRLAIIRSNGEVGYLIDRLHDNFIRVRWGLRGEAVGATKDAIEVMDATLNDILNMLEELEELQSNGAH